MAAITDYIQDNWKSIECQFYASMGLGAYGAAFASIFTPAPIIALGWTAIGGAFELGYNLAGCDGTPPLPPPPAQPCGPQCWKTQGGAELTIKVKGGPAPGLPIDYSVVQILSLVWNEPNQSWDTTYIKTDGTNHVYQFRNLTSSDTVCADLSGGGECYEQAPIIPPPHEPGEPIGDPVEVPIEDCVWTVTPIDSYVDQSGVAHIYYRVEANDPACGGPYEYWSSDQGPKFVQPDPEKPEPTPPPDSVTCPDPCQDYSSDFASIQAKLEELLNCACNEPAPVLEGEFRTISFRSDETSPYGKSRLRKRLRYRSVSGNDLGTLVDYWKDFSYEGGPYRVRWSGGAWGTVEVWAATEAEGKRVIQHAAGEAGFDPFKSGGWSTRVRRSSRLGVQLLVRVDTSGGYYWITARDGSSQRPIVAIT